MEDTKRVVLSLKDKILTVMCSIGILLIMAAIFNFCVGIVGVTDFIDTVSMFSISFKLAFLGVVMVWLSVILDKAGRG